MTFPALQNLPQRRVLVDGVPALCPGAVPAGSQLQIELYLPRRLGAAAVSVCLHADALNAGAPTAEHTYPARYVGGDGVVDCFAASVATDELQSEGGLFYWHFSVDVGRESSLQSDTQDNDTMTLTADVGREYRLLLYAPDFDTPHWMRGGVMYHIFLDRFCRGQGPAALHPGAVLNEDWEHGVPPYAEKPGQPLANNVFFGGNLWGVIEKLDYLQKMGVTILYLSPLFTAASNHRYDTGDYETVDSLLGGEEAFAAFLTAAHAHGMRVVLDGVFNHTGDDSRYFNHYGHYDSVGAAQSQASPYYDWYAFRHWPDDYEAWWNVSVLPRLRSDLPACRDYICQIAADRVKQGVDGWRLDVADELSDTLLDKLRTSTHAAFAAREKTDVPLILGEVWENAADKVAYGYRRRYLQGAQLDSVMNYPFREGVLDYMESGDCTGLCATLTEIYASYPRAVCDVLMNLLGTHDTERILSVLGDREAGFEVTNAPLATKRLTTEQRNKAVALLKLAAAIQFTVYGVPSVFYGDEAGMEGYRDPFCRMPFPWGHEDKDLQAYYTVLGEIRKMPTFAKGAFKLLTHAGPVLAFTRGDAQNETVLVAVNRGKTPAKVPLPQGFTPARELLTGATIKSGDDNTVTIPPLTACVYVS